VTLAILWGALILSFSQSSFGALLVGLGVLAALRFGLRPVIAVGAVVGVIGLVVVVAAPGLIHLNTKSSRSVDKATSGRIDLMRGGIRMFGDRPLFGFGSGAFSKEFRKSEGTGRRQAASASHTIPITVAAEQGVPGLGAYAAVLIASFGLMFSGLGRQLRERAPPPRLVTRAYLAAAYSGLVLHTMLYAAFLEDPITWTLIAAAIVLGRTGGATSSSAASSSAEASASSSAEAAASPSASAAAP